MRRQPLRSSFYDPVFQPSLISEADSVMTLSKAVTIVTSLAYLSPADHNLITGAVFYRKYKPPVKAGFTISYPIVYISLLYITGAE